jgi:quinol monooxygenase YgiN
MYGTVARIQVKPGNEEAARAVHDRWLWERQPEATGFIAVYVLESERVPGEWLVMTIFNSEANYRKNASDPEQHRQYEALRALLEREPEWNDGEIVAVEPASVPV